MKASTRIGSLDIAEAMRERSGSYVHDEFMEFLAADGDYIHLWYSNSGGEGPSFHIQLVREEKGWRLMLAEHPPGTEQSIEVP